MAVTTSDPGNQRHVEGVEIVSQQRARCHPRGNIRSMENMDILYYQLYKKHKEKCRTSKKTFILEQMDIAEQAASSHNQRLLYQVVRALAPKSRRGRPQLREANGQIMTRGEEATCFQQHFTAKFTASDDGIAALQDTDCGAHSPATNSGVPHDKPQLSPQTLEHHLSHAPLRKAVLPDHPPSSVWRLCSDIVAEKVCHVICLCFATCLRGTNIMKPDRSIKRNVRLISAQMPRAVSLNVATVTPSCATSPVYASTLTSVDVECCSLCALSHRYL